jgi:predicted  nucleic acid-binding Zn-ribbon protein
MGYLKYTPYIYLIFALYFIYEAIVKWSDPGYALVECDDCWTCNFMFSSGENMQEDGP